MSDSPEGGSGTEAVVGKPAGATSRKSKSAWVDVIETLVITVIVAFFLRQFVLQVNEIKGSSMEPTLYTAERVVNLKFIYYLRKPQPGEIVVLANPYVTGKDDFIKRVVAVAGDTVEYRNGQLYVNGKAIPEPYVRKGGKEMKALKVPEGNVFVLGDNRPASVDGRWFGTTAVRDVEGMAVLRFWPLNRWHLFHPFSR